jgi:hypothetical protein
LLEERGLITSGLKKLLLFCRSENKENPDDETYTDDCLPERLSAFVVAIVGIKFGSCGGGGGLGTGRGDETGEEDNAVGTNEGASGRS